MKLVDVIFFSIILTIFSSVISESVTEVRKMDLKIEELYLKTSSINFISRSFCNTCSGKGFENFYEWEKVCRALWKLEEIKWESADGNLYHGRWKGPCGNGEVFCRRQESKNESEN